MTQLEEAVAMLRAQIITERAQNSADRVALDGREQATDGKEQALKVLEGMLETKPAVARSPAAANTDGPQELINLDELEGGESQKRKTLVDDIRDVIRRFGAQEFSIVHVESAMKRLGVEIAGKTPRSRISMAFTKLGEDGHIVRTFTGGGNVPHRYRLRESMTDDEAARYKSSDQGAVNAADAHSAAGDGGTPRQSPTEDEIA